jgi:hypothetical protein
MDMKRTIVTLALLALAACGAQPEPPAEGPLPAGERPVVIDMTGGGTPSIRGLIGERQRLALTGAQVTTLDSLAIVLAAANDSLRAGMVEATPAQRSRPGATQAQWERNLPALQTIAQNNRAAGLLVQQVLTEDQRRIACEIQAEDEARRPRAARTPPRPPTRIGGRVIPGDSIPEPQRGWPWCPPAPPPLRR